MEFRDFLKFKRDEPDQLSSVSSLYQGLGLGLGHLGLGCLWYLGLADLRF